MTSILQAASGLRLQLSHWQEAGCIAGASSIDIIRREVR